MPEVKTNTAMSVKSKTAMQELIEYLDEYNEVFGMMGLSIRDRASILLEKEKLQILSGYDCGKEQVSTSQLCPIDYYNQTFNK